MLDNLSIYYQNCRGIRTKLNTLYINILSHAYDIIILTETWLTPDISDSEFIDSRYTVFRHDRDRAVSNKKDGGGVLIAIFKELIPSSLTLSPPLILPEHQIVKVPLYGCKNLLVCVTYIPPSTSEEIYINFINALSKLFDDPNIEHIIFSGDFNLPELNWVNATSYMVCANNNTYSRTSRHLLNFCSLFDLNQFNNFKNCNGRVLDLIYCNMHAVALNPNTPLLPIDTHHPPFFIQIPFKKPSRMTTKSNIKPLNYRKSNYNAIKSDIGNTDWNTLLDKFPPDEAVSIFYEKIYEIIKLHTPTHKPKNLKFPYWFTKSLLHLFKMKSRAWIKWKKYGNISDYELFSIYRAKFKKQADICYKKYMNFVEDSVANNVKAFWTYISNRNPTNSIPGTVYYRQQSSNDPTTTCNLFSTFFQSVYEASTFDHMSWVPPPDNPHNDNNICNLHFSLYKIKKALKSLDASKGPGPDGIPSIFLKNTCDTLCFPLFILYNKCLASGVFPDVWKRANIVPIHKGGSKSDVSTYRPISLLSGLSKLFERLVHNEIYPFIHRVILKEQHGFIRGRSCISNLLIFTTHLFEGLDNREQIDAVYTDFQKAFDKVDHELLLNKIAFNGIRGDLLRWFVSYVTNRTQKVVINGFESRTVRVTSGVPQGSILGPLLFILFINDIKYCFKNSKFLLYADDLKIYKNIAVQTDCLDFQKDLDCFSEYCTVNKLHLNISKCYSITFTKKKLVKNFDYFLGNTALNKVSSLRDLGVNLDSKLHLDTHVDNIVNKAYKMFGFVMRASREFHRPSTYLHLYKSIIRPQLEYAIPIWNPHYKKYVEIIELVQRKYLRSMHYKCCKSRMSYQPLLEKYNIMTLQSRRTLLDMLTLFSICRNKFDCTDLVNRLCFLIPRTVIGRQVRSRRLFATPVCKTNAGVRSPLHRLVDTYNKQFGSTDIMFLSKDVFKSEIITILRDHNSGN